MARCWGLLDSAKLVQEQSKCSPQLEEAAIETLGNRSQPFLRRFHLQPQCCEDVVTPALAMVTVIVIDDKGVHD